VRPTTQWTLRPAIWIHCRPYTRRAGTAHHSPFVPGAATTPRRPSPAAWVWRTATGPAASMVPGDHQPVCTGEPRPAAKGGYRCDKTRDGADQEGSKATECADGLPAGRASCRTVSGCLTGRPGCRSGALAAGRANAGRVGGGGRPVSGKGIGGPGTGLETTEARGAGRRLGHQSFMVSGRCQACPYDSSQKMPIGLSIRPTLTRPFWLTAL
jgi:hypothetical protein